MIRKIFASAIVILGLAPSTHADMIYSFRFGSSSTGSFRTGAESTDAGFFLVTSLQVNTFTDQTSGPVPVSFHATMPGEFAPGTAYNPTTGAFENHFSGGSFTNLGDIGNTGQGESPAGTINGQEAYLLGPSFSAGSSALALQGSGTNGTVYTASGILIISPQSVPEPSSFLLCGLGIGGAISLLRPRRARLAGLCPRESAVDN